MWYCRRSTVVVVRKGEDEKCQISPFLTLSAVLAIRASNILSLYLHQTVTFLYAGNIHFTLVLCTISLISCINDRIICIFNPLPIHIQHHFRITISSWCLCGKDVWEYTMVFPSLAPYFTIRPLWLTTTVTMNCSHSFFNYCERESLDMILPILLYPLQ